MTSQSKKRSNPGRRPIRVVPRQKERIDPELVALCYYLIASQIVRDQRAAETGAEATADSEGTAREAA